MAKNRSAKTVSGKKTLLYTADQMPPAGPLIFSSLQHMLLALSMGLALPISVARAAGLDIAHSSALLAASLFAMGFATILQTVPGKFIGSGNQSISTCDSAAISASLLAAEIGGIPLVLGMTVFGCVVRFLLGSFSFRLRKLFPPEVTGTMVFILGINLVPTGFKYFLGAADASGVYNPMHILVAGLTLLFMLASSLFIKPLKPYTALAGIAFGYIISAIAGIFDLSAFSALSERAAVALPVYPEFAVSFDMRAVIPFLIIAVAAVVDNIGDFAAAQSANDPELDKPDWHSIERGIRGGALGTLLPAFFGGTSQSTATTNIGIAGASGITSRKVGYLAGAMLMVIAFFPGVSGTLSIIPEPVLGAVLLYSMCYIMAGGFSTIASRELDDRRIFTVFLSVGAAVSTLIPGLYDFLPADAKAILATPMVMGVCVLLVTTLLGRIGAKKTYSFITGVNSADVRALNQEMETVCRSWGADHVLLRKLQMSLNALAEGIFEEAPETRLNVSIRYDGMQVKLHLETEGSALTDSLTGRGEDDISSLSIALAMLPNLFDQVRTKWINDTLSIDMDADM